MDRKTHRKAATMEKKKKRQENEYRVLYTNLLIEEGRKKTH